MFRTLGLSCLHVVLALATMSPLSAASARDLFFRVPLADLQLTEGQWPTETFDWSAWWSARNRPPYAVLDGPGEVYVQHVLRRPNSNEAERIITAGTVVIRLEQSRDVTGRLFLPAVNGRGMTTVRFRVPATRIDPDARQRFFEVKRDYYESLLARDVPGGAWFRYQARQAQAELGEPPADDPDQRGAFFVRGRTAELADTYAMFSGGRAMSENLQLDRVLQAAPGNDESVDLSTLGGITVPEIDWKPLVEGLQPSLDPLAARIPHDQHAIFFPTFNDAVALADEMAASGSPILQMAEPRSTDARTLDRYQQQMCLTISGVARLIGPAVVQSVAITGSDPYFRTGTDVAVLFEASDPAVFEQLLMTQVQLAAAGHAQVESIQGEVDGLAYRGVRSPDRSICCYVAKTDGLVIVTNSPVQLSKLASVDGGKALTIASLDEYRYFRQRYLRGEGDETAFLFLSDATIRRWCGPRWRIATSRRTRDAALVAEIQAGHLDRLVAGGVEPGTIYTQLPLSADGTLSLTPSGVTCSSLGSLAFMTPIAEMEMDRVSKAEAEAYEQWRDRYQSNWRWAFDPIALRLTVHAERLGGDLTIMPLIWGSRYRSLISVSRGAAVPPTGGDLHDAMAHVILAINTQSEAVQQQSNMARMLAGGLQIDPIGWLGQSVAAYVDDGPFWKDLAEVDPDQREDFLERQGLRIPVAVRADVKSGFKLTAFLAAVRAFIEQASPGMLNWEALTYRDQPYVKVTPTERAIGRSEEIRNLAVYYSASGTALIVTLDQQVLERAIERELAAGDLPDQAAAPPAPARHWMGENVGLQIDQRFLKLLAMMTRTQYQNAMQLRAWDNLVILNEWKQRYPDKDPVALHEQFWNMRLTCPGDGQYVWNEECHSMESTVYGCPAVPKPGPSTPPQLATIKFGNFGLTFEDQGLRARVSLER